MYSLIIIRITYEKVCNKFSSILTHPKKFIDTSKNKLSEKSKIQLSINSPKNSQYFEN